MAPLHLLVIAPPHVVTQVVKAQLVVGGISYVAVIGLFLGSKIHVGKDCANCYSEECVDLAHPLGIPLGQVVVYCNNMDTLA